jgi:phosphatidylglycerophosphatase A
LDALMINQPVNQSTSQPNAMFISKVIASCFGIGYMQKGAGTVAALFCCLIWYFLKGAETDAWFQVMLLLSLFILGVWVSTVVEEEWGHDSNRVVFDEVHGMLISLFLLPQNWIYPLLAFVLFRFFDIAKPLGIRKMERFGKGYGVMADDLLAGLYSNVLLQIVAKAHLFP